MELSVCNKIHNKLQGTLHKCVVHSIPVYALPSACHRKWGEIELSVMNMVSNDYSFKVYFANEESFNS